MAFFRKWKTHYKHKKFTDGTDGEDWGIDKTIKGLPDGATGGVGKLNVDEDDNESGPPLTTYEIKYLGCTSINTKRSEKITSEAIKSVIANSKGGGRKKTHTRVKLNVSPEGIEVLEHQTGVSLMRFSIYKISYCSVDAAHDHAFSFVGSEKDSITDEEKLSCYVFLCPKRKIAHEITLNVARCFENAYQHWRQAVVTNIIRQGMSVDGPESKKILKELNNRGSIGGGGGGGADVKPNVEVHYQKKEDDKKSEDLLIDLASSDFCTTAGGPNENDIRKYLQNTWVSFEDDPRDGVQLVAC